MRTILLTLVLALPVAMADSGKILFIRGGAGTVGFFEGGSDEQGASIYNYIDNTTNHGWGELAAALIAEGFSLEEMSEDSPTGVPDTPIPLESLDLTEYELIVFGSNNAPYTSAQVNALTSYVNGGGAALFISDANFGSNWTDAPSSDQHFLTPFGLVMNQDTGTYTLSRSSGDFLAPAHPIFNGVDNFDGEGVSPGTVNAGIATLGGVTRTILSKAKGNVRRNTPPFGGQSQGSTSTNTASDGTLILAEYGSGRIAIHFDRNTFFNLNGAGTNINRFDNEGYARNLFNWLTGKPAFNPATDNYAPRAHFPDFPPGRTVAGNASVDVRVIAKDPDGTIVSVELLLDGSSVSTDTTTPYQWTLPGLSAGNHVLTARVTDNDGAVTEVPVSVGAVSPINRTGWVLTASLRNDITALAVDGSLTTRWATHAFQSPGMTFRVDFPQDEFIDRIVLETPGHANDYPRGYIVRGSIGGGPFSVIASEASTPAGATTNIVLDRPGVYRSIQIEQTGSSPVNWWSIQEINIYRPVPDTVLPLLSWREFHFGADATNPALEGTLWGNDLDPDLDGMNNFLEFAFGLDPTLADTASPVTTSFLPGGLSLDLTYPRWKEENGVSYDVEGAQDLSVWNSAGITVTPTGTAVDNGDGTENQTLRVEFNSGAPRHFVRMRVDESSP